ncbi:MAG: hypothetical protein IPH13_06165 [Planctomycetes bacterium]|nr:hypothetical protein [Planctomycetota bacterium]MCC7172506.1 hypothetical protein [Planctomycetota bacterium]
MRRFSVAFLFIAIGLCGCASDDPVRGTIDRAFAARAPAEPLVGFGGWERDVEGTWRGMPFRSHVVYGRPTLLRQEFEPFGFGRAEVTVSDGKQIFREERGGRARMHAEDVQIFRDVVFDEALLFLAELREPSFARELVEQPAPRAGRDVVQLIVGSVAVSERVLTFDAETFDLISIAGNTWTGVGESGREAVETVFHDHALVDGMRLPGRYEVFVNGVVVSEGRYVRWKPRRDIPTVTIATTVLPSEPGL